jgi:UPF0755 protein
VTPRDPFPAYEVSRPHERPHDGDDLQYEPVDDDSFFGDYDGVEDDDRGPRVSRAQRRRSRQRRQTRRLLTIALALFVVVVGVATWLVVIPVYHYLHPDDYSGGGSGRVVVTVHAGDGAAQIGSTLVAKKVVASERAFTAAAKADPRSTGIEAGSYLLRRHMAAKRALGLLLSSGSRLRGDVTVTEGATVVDVEKQLVAPSCETQTSSANRCGPGLTTAAVGKALADVASLDLPTDYTAGGTPASVEGFLFPATYYFPAGTSASDALQRMIGNFVDQVHGTDIATRAKTLGITPYQELVIASIAQGEAKYPADFPKVARVILNRMAAKRPLQIDATSAYAAKLQGLDPSKVDYATIAGPYNTYRNAGLPPTPIGNPDLVALKAAAQPADGNWLYYVNGDKAGHLAFTDNEKTFERLAATCRKNNWGCG